MKQLTFELVWHAENTMFYISHVEEERDYGTSYEHPTMHFPEKLEKVSKLLTHFGIQWMLYRLEPESFCTYSNGGIGGRPGLAKFGSVDEFLERKRAELIELAGV